MNKQRKVVITTTYNEMGIIIDTKAEEVPQPNLQPTCNQLATDTISRQAAIDALKQCTMHCVTPDSYHIDADDATHRISVLPSAQSDNSNESEPPHSCKTCKYNALHWYEEPCDSCTGDSWRPYGGDQDDKN